MLTLSILIQLKVKVNVFIQVSNVPLYIERM